jgi:hypothetical protein
MKNQRLITGIELLPNGTEMQVVKVAEVREQKLIVRWEYWREAQMRSYHGQPGEVDLGDIFGGTSESSDVRRLCLLARHLICLDIVAEWV